MNSVGCDFILKKIVVVKNLVRLDEEIIAATLSKSMNSLLIGHLRSPNVSYVGWEGNSLAQVAGQILR